MQLYRFVAALASLDTVLWEVAAQALKGDPMAGAHVMLHGADS
jgi:hypothetical protein